MSSPIAILGRGISLKRYAALAHLFEKVYLVNPFTREIEKLGVEHFEGKELVHVVSKGNDCRLRESQYALFPKVTVTANATKNVFPVHYLNFQPSPDCMKDRGFPLVGWDDITAILSRLPDLTHEALILRLDEEYADVITVNNARATASIRCWPTTGLFAIDLALMAENPQVVYLFGFDCYSRGIDSYFIRKHKSHQTKNARDIMRYYLGHLVKEFTATLFYSADEQPDITEPNWAMIPTMERTNG